VSAGLGSRRHTKSHPCPVCGGHPGLARARGIRCAGLTLDFVCYCTRPELAGPLALDVSKSPASYVHRLRGECGCGAVHEGVVPFPPLPVVSYTPISPSEGRERDRVYREALDALALRRAAFEDIQRRGLSEADIIHFRFRSLPVRGREHTQFMARMRERCHADLLGTCPGFVDKNGRDTFWTAYNGRDGFVVPYFDEAGLITGFQAKLLGGRYLTPSGARYSDMYSVAGVRQTTLFVVEGGLKAMVASALGPAWCFGVPGQSIQDAHLSAIKRLQPERVAVALDREVNIDTDRARTRWLELLAGTGIPVFDAVWEGA
jgi:hypothetical protein